LRLFLLKILGLATVSTSLALSADFSLEGSFLADDQVQLFTFSLNSASTVALRTWSYAGGINALRETIPSGGFDPILTLFSSSGLLIDQNDDGSQSLQTEQGFDANLEANLSPGTYVVSLTQFDNFAVGPSLNDGFRYSQSPTFTSFFGCSNGRFCDSDANDRTGKWAVDFVGVASASSLQSEVPESGTTVITLVGFIFSSIYLRLARVKTHDHN